MPRFQRLVLTAMLVALCAAPFGGPAEAEQAPAVVFTHGIASGDVTPASAVLWTRVDREADLIAEVAKDGAFGQVVARRSAPARLANDLTVTVLVAPLEPGRTYHYRFRAGRSLSETGSFRTAPRPDQARDVRFT